MYGMSVLKYGIIVKNVSPKLINRSKHSNKLELIVFATGSTIYPSLELVRSKHNRVKSIYALKTIAIFTNFS